MLLASLINISDRYRLFEWGVLYIILSLGFHCLGQSEQLSQSMMSLRLENMQKYAQLDGLSEEICRTA